MIRSADLCPESSRNMSTKLIPEKGILLPGAPADELFRITGDAVFLAGCPAYGTPGRNDGSVQEAENRSD